MKTFRNFIAGQWVAPSTDAYFDNVNPADTSDVIGRFPGQQPCVAEHQRLVAAPEVGERPLVVNRLGHAHHGAAVPLAPGRRDGHGMEEALEQVVGDGRHLPEPHGTAAGPAGFDDGR